MWQSWIVFLLLHDGGAIAVTCIPSTSATSIAGGVAASLDEPTLIVTA
jgi:hypothetical protein